MDWIGNDNDGIVGLINALIIELFQILKRKWMIKGQRALSKNFEVQK